MLKKQKLETNSQYILYYTYTYTVPPSFQWRYQWFSTWRGEYLGSVRTNYGPIQGATLEVWDRRVENH